VANRDNSSSVSCRTKNPHDIWRHISIFFRGMSNFFTFSTISRRRTPNDVLQDGKIQRNPGKVTMVFAVFMLYWRGSLSEGHIICRLYHLPCFDQGRQERWQFFSGPSSKGGQSKNIYTKSHRHLSLVWRC
jgi:hypothetical protein